MAKSLKVAVIGAGPAGLVAARELQREGHQVVVYEKASRLGGIWVYDANVESDLLGIDPNRKIVQSGLYHSLRTNLPRDLMSFSDYPFAIRENGDSRNFPKHEEVLWFLEKFAEEFRLIGLMRFETEVVRVEQVGGGGDAMGGEWVVESRNGGSLKEEVFEAVVVCNGHFSQPRIAKLQGGEKWPGKQIHSRNYRVPETFRDEVVVMIGSGPSAQDIAKEILIAAKHVHISSRDPKVKISTPKDNTPNFLLHPNVRCVSEDGQVTFEDGVSIHADTILHCTGYKYAFPFLKTNGTVTIDDNRVGPLYKHTFPPQLAPTLSFVGIPAVAVLFQMLESQAKWVAKVLSGKLVLPTKEEMLDDTEEFYNQMEEAGIPKHRTHYLDPFKFDYVDWLASEIGEPPVDDRLKDLFRVCIAMIVNDKNGVTRD
ncbi:oxygenase [Lithospermum erythrorhizon]|uniref:Flavin-containing monooxygenase n=1 Tax=Lithospermum erythrorhizon TaxID=34254 RepID=A0AAV3NX28_LITER